MAFKNTLKKHGFSDLEINYLERKVDQSVNVEPFLSQKEREKIVLNEHLQDMQDEKESILRQVNGDNTSI